MNTLENFETFFELIPVSAKIKSNKSALLLKKKRIIVGSSEHCDLIIRHSKIQAIHAVIELGKEKDCGILYDMNSVTGTFVNNEKIITSNFKIGDKISFGGIEFIFKNYVKEDILPPILDILTEQKIGKNAEQRVEQKIEQKIEQQAKTLPETPSKFSSTATIKLKEALTNLLTDKNEKYSIAYPLTRDPKAIYSEYIFEDSDTIYPIFKYSDDIKAVEVIILFKERIYLVDYFLLEGNNKTIYLQGMLKEKDKYNVHNRMSDSGVEYVHLGKNEKIEFIEINANEAYISPIEGHELLRLSDKNNINTVRKTAIKFKLQNDDILRFKLNDTQIFVRKTNSPPQLANPPFLRRDKDLRKYLYISLLSVLLLLFFVMTVKIDKEEFEEKAPERLATVLYKMEDKKIIEERKKFLTKPPIEQKIEQKIWPKKEIPKKEPPKVEEKIVAKPAELSKPKLAPKVAEPPKAAKSTTANPTRPSEIPKVNDVRGGGVPSIRTVDMKFKSPGHVDAYKSEDFASTINTMVARGSSAVKSVHEVSWADGGSGFIKTQTIGSPDGTSLKHAVIEAGSKDGIKGVNTTVLDQGQGKLDEVGEKKGIYTAGTSTNTVIMGSIDPAIIRKILIDHLPEFRYCYQKQLDRSPKEFEGVIPITFVIGASGRVVKAGIDGDTSLPVNVHECVVNVLKSIQFPAPKGGGQVETHQPIRFYPKRIY
ncbi:MAG: AgmX/PglI C-terminal domain-containing protein [Oligoflexia bacterium]|nr:AgmX/PglI C-terminal domain-containing protein [Oligoflexia bacterium]